MELGRTYSPNVEISALINLGFDYGAAGQHERALASLEPTLERVEQEALGSHRWRWRLKLLIGLAELYLTTGATEQALHYVDAGLQDALATSSLKYMAKGRAVRGKILAALGDSDAAGFELQRALTFAEQVQSPTLLYPIAYDLGQWHERVGKEWEAEELYRRAKAAIEEMATVVEDQALRSIFLQSAPVQVIYAHIGS